jgi:pyruvate dehydrogenase E2 component (dihydrolipoamide acetyltransferase)
MPPVTGTKQQTVAAERVAKSEGVSVALTRIQRLIGRRMLLSKRTKPCFYLAARADTTELIRLRPKLRKSLKVKVTTNAFYLKALAVAVEEYPLMAGKPDGDYIRLAKSISVGFAVNAPQGLVVPVIREADLKSLVDIATEERILTDKARSNKLTLEDMEGETVALSNLGIYGMDSFHGIVPPPASTILAVGNVVRTPVPWEGRIAIHKLTNLNLAVDGRVANEFYAAGFMRYIVELLEDPERLL